MTTFYPQQSDRKRCVRQKTGTSALQITATNCTAKLHSYVHEARKIRCNNWQGAGQAYAAELKFYTKQALPLVRTRILRLANSSPEIARSPARRSRDGRETFGKKSGEISRVMSAQRPGAGRTVATAMPLNVRQDGSQDNLPCAGLGRAMSAPETCETNSQYVRATAVSQSSRRPMQHLASDSWEFRRQLLTMTPKNYEHTNHTNA